MSNMGVSATYANTRYKCTISCLSGKDKPPLPVGEGVEGEGLRRRILREIDWPNIVVRLRQFPQHLSACCGWRIQHLLAGNRSDTQVLPGGRPCGQAIDFIGLERCPGICSHANHQFIAVGGQGDYWARSRHRVSSSRW